MVRALPTLVETFGLRDLAAVVRAVGMGSLFAVLTVAYLYRFEGFSRGVFLLDALLLGMAIVATRASFRTMSLAAAVRNKRSRRVLVYGAGQFGQTLVREMRANARWNMNPIAFIDDDPGKVRRWIMGVQVRGTLDELEATCDAIPLMRSCWQSVDQRPRRASDSGNLHADGAAGTGDCGWNSVISTRDRHPESASTAARLPHRRPVSGDTSRD
jgi:FlaA1/EpsC-like NDP-sugar epimerase